MTVCHCVIILIISRHLSDSFPDSPGFPVLIRTFFTKISLSLLSLSYDSQLVGQSPIHHDHFPTGASRVCRELLRRPVQEQGESRALHKQGRCERLRRRWLSSSAAKRSEEVATSVETVIYRTGWSSRLLLMDRRLFEGWFPRERKIGESESLKRVKR